jgi:hypothetical protein
LPAGPVFWPPCLWQKQMQRHAGTGWPSPNNAGGRWRAAQVSNQQHIKLLLVPSSASCYVAALTDFTFGVTFHG